MMTMISSTVINAHETRHLADLFPRHLPQRFAVTAHGGEQDDEILHGPA
jgi:hypothetical protein